MRSRADDSSQRTGLSFLAIAVLGAEEGGVYVLVVVHGRSRRTIDPRIPAMPGRSTSGLFSRTRKTLLAPSAKRREGSGESHEG